MSPGIKEMFTQVAMRVVELSKQEPHDTKLCSYTSYTSSQAFVNTSNNEHQSTPQYQPPQEEEDTPKPTIKLTEEDKKKSWCCW